MLNITNIEDALVTWVEDVSGLTAVIAHPNARRPETPYVLINIIQSTPIGIEEHEDALLVDDSIDIEYSNVDDIFVSINTYYAGAYQLATKLKDSLARVTITDDLFAAGLGYSRATTVNDIPEEIDKKWEQRGQFDCFFFTRSLDSENIETIQKVEITNELDGSTVIIEKPIP